MRDLTALTQTRVDQHGKRFLLRSQLTSVCSKVFQAVGVALPPAIRPDSPQQTVSA